MPKQQLETFKTLVVTRHAYVGAEGAAYVMDK
jgi:hypothetical protein